MPGQTWPGTAASFLGMWVVMMVAMMLPSLIPSLWRYREATGEAGGARRGLQTALVAVAYFGVWAAVGLAVFPLGVAVAAIVARQPALARAIPLAAGMIVLLAGLFQHTRWKARHLARCREASSDHLTLPTTARAAWRHGLRLGLHCTRSCAGLTAVALSLGLMDIRVMAALTAAITAERVAPGGVRAARAIGVVGIIAGFLMLTRAAGLGAGAR